MKPKIQILLLLVILSVGCTNQKNEIDAIRKETGKTLFGDPADLRYKLSTYVYDQQDEDASSDLQVFPEPSPELIREKVSALPWGNSRFSVGVGIAQGTVWLAKHKILSVSANAELESGELEPLTATIDEATESGGRVKKECRLESPNVIADLLIAYLNQNGEHLDMVEWQVVD